jgi:type I restriction enzyme S subunit
MVDPRWAIPASWQWARLSEIADIVGGGTPSTREEGGFSEPGIPWITPADLTHYDDAYIGRGRRSLSERGYSTSSAQIVPAGTVLFSSRAPIGYCAIAANPLATSQGFKNLLLRDVSPEYVRYYLLASRDYAQSFASGTTFLELSGARVGELMIPIAPRAEQTRIVEQIDGLLLRVARGSKDLAGIPSLVATWKRRILELAFSGGLSSSLAKSRAPAWPMLRLSEAITDIVAGKSLRCEERPPEPGEKGVIKVSAVTWGAFDPRETKTLPQSFTPQEKTRIRPGDLLISRANTLELVGAPVIVHCTPDNLYLSDKVLRLESEPADRPWLLWFLRSPQGRAAIEARASGNQLSMRNLSQKLLLDIEAPWPDAETRQDTVERIEAAFERLDRALADHADATRLLTALKAAVLEKAFRGSLVPQNPSDEPAETLLARVAADLAAKPAQRPKKSRRRNVDEERTDVNKDLEEVLAEAGDWLPAQTAFQRSGIGDGAETDAIERAYARLRELDAAGRLEVEAVTTAEGRKLYDRLRLKVA